MESPETGDEDANPHPAPVIKFMLSLGLLLLLASCRQETKRSVPPAKTKPDTATARERVPDSIVKTPVEKKKIYLTFDDGPNKGTLNVYTAIREEQVPASFFIVGLHVDDTQEQHRVWEQLKADTTIELCNHSYTHARNRYASFYKNPAGVVEDFERNQTRLGFGNRIARMPGRNAWRMGQVRHTDITESRKAIDSVNQAGFDILGWDIEWTFDHTSLAPDADTALLMRRIQNMLESGHTQTPGHLVLLAHDQSFRRDSAVVMLKEFIGRLKTNPDYELVLASKYPSAKK